jgi:hypothetical protein
MKRTLLILAAMSLLVLQYGISAGKNFTVDAYVGKVLFSQNKGKTWKPVSIEMSLKESDMIKTGKNAYCDILMPGQGVFRASDNTTLSISKLDGKNTKIDLNNGKVAVKVTKKLKGDETFLVQTDVGVAAVRGTEFILDTDNKKVGLEVDNGTVNLKRNVNIPEGVELDEDMQKYLEIDATANQTIEFTMDENKTLEQMINRAKNNKDELLSVLKNSHDATAKKLHIMKKNIHRIFGELGNERSGNDQPEMNDQSGDEDQNNGSDDDTGDVINKAKSKLKK